MKLNIKFTFLIFLILSFGCEMKNENIIYYNYNNITITRVDNGNEIRFYYGKFKNLNSLPKSYIKSTYNGFDGLMSCFLIFKNNKSVEFIKMDGSFEKINTNENLKIIEFNNNIDFIKWNDKIQNKYKNVIELSNVLKIEIKRNKKNKSEVISIYP